MLVCCLIDQELHFQLVKYLKEQVLTPKYTFCNTTIEGLYVNQVFTSKLSKSNMPWY